MGCGDDTEEQIPNNTVRYLHLSRVKEHFVKMSGAPIRLRYRHRNNVEDGAVDMTVLNETA